MTHCQLFYIFGQNDMVRFHDYALTPLYLHPSTILFLRHLFSPTLVPIY